MRIDLGNSQWADVKDVDDLRAGDRRAVNKQITLRVDQETHEVGIPGDMDDNMRNALLARIITGWNLQWPVPNGRTEILDKLTMTQIDALYKGVQEHFDVIRGKDEDPAEKGSDPTGASSSSGTTWPGQGTTSS